MDTHRKTPIFISCMVFLFFSVMIGLALGRIDNIEDIDSKQEIFLHDLNIKYNELSNQFNQVIRDMAVLKATNQGLSNQLLDLYISTLPVNIQKKIDIGVENTNVLSEECTSKIIGQQISRNYYAPAKSNIPEYMILSFPEGDLVIDREGEINCYKTPVQELNPNPVKCSQICDVKEVEPVSKMLPVIQSSKTI